MNFTNSLIEWYLENKRDLPWRNTTNPYHIWLSEIILQQTRVAQGMPYYFAFTKVFPTVFYLANATEEQVLKLWQGLGYYSRARNLLTTAQYVVNEFDGVFPNSYNELIKLKGVGEYTAAAIASFSFNEAVPVVDGNVFRVLSRYFDIETDIAQASAKKEFAALASELMLNDGRDGVEMSITNPAIFNQAIMEFGALQCVPKSPNCAICVFATSCAALQKNKVNQLPVKSKKVNVQKRYFNYIVASDDLQKTIIQKRTTKGIWYNLYEFPLIETAKEEGFDFIYSYIEKEFFKDITIISLLEYNSESTVHKLSHQHLHIKFWQVNLKGIIKNGIDFEYVKTFPFPIVIHNFIEEKL